MKYQCLIVDDEPLAIDILASYITTIDELHVAGTCRNAMETYQFLQQHKVDLVFLDIRMPKINGMELAKSLANPPKIIFTTASREFAAESYEINTIDYLIKPISYDRFLKAINRFLPSGRVQDHKISAKVKSHIFIKADNKVYKVQTDRITYIESFKDFIKIHQSDAPTITSYQSISNMENVLPSKQFLRAHRSFIVNLDHVISYSSTCIEIDGNDIPIGRTYKELVRDALER